MTAVILFAIVATLSMMAASIVMLQPKHSAQAQPHMANLHVSEIPPALESENQDPNATYRDLSDPVSPHCTDLIPEGEETPRVFT